MAFSSREIEIFVKAKALRWKNRRYMAWVALFSMILALYWAIFKIPDLDRIKALTDIIVWYLIIMGSIVGAYMGFSTLDDKWQQKIKNTKSMLTTEDEAKNLDNEA